MSKVPKRPNEVDDLREQDDQARPDRSKSTKPKRSAASKKANAALRLPDADMPNGVLEELEGNSSPSLSPTQTSNVSRSGSLPVEGNQNAPDRPDPSSIIGNTAGRPVHSVDPVSEEVKLSVVSKPPQPREGVEMLAQKPEPTQHHPVGHYGTPDLKDDFPRGIKQKAENSTSVWGPRLQAASDRVSNTSERVKVWAQEERKVDMSANVRKAVNPIYILAAVTLGIPALLLILLIGLNPGVLEGSLTAVATFLVISAFITAAVFEIKRLADQSSDEEHY